MDHILMCYLKMHPQTKGHQDFLCDLMSSFTVLHFIFMSVMHFELIL